MLCVGGEDNTITCWNPRTGEKVATLTGHQGDVMDLAITPDGRLMVSASDDTSLLVWKTPVVE
jgi:WD40 repeat protein